MLSQLFSEQNPLLTWQSLVERHTTEGLGWGELKKAYWLAEMLGPEVGALPEDLLALHQAGTGWGEMLKQYRTSQGKPPWASQGPPPWAKGKGQSDEEIPVGEGIVVEGQNGGGHGNGNHNGNGNGNRNGNGNGHGPKK